jgi:hypothetical protein
MRRRYLCGLTVVGFALGLGAGGGARAQEAPVVITDLYSQADVRAEASGFNVSYALADFTVPSIAQGAFPIANTSLTADPLTKGLASIAYPGALLANLPAVVKQSDPRAPDLPPYPIVAEASTPSDKQTAEAGNGTMRVDTDDLGATAVADYSQPFNVPGLDSAMRGAAMKSATSSAVESGKVVSRALSTLSGVNILNGLVTIDSITTELVAVSDGKTATSAGTTTVTGAKFLGLDAIIDGDGIRLAAPPDAGPASGLGGVVGGLTPVTAQLNALMKQLTGSAGTNLNGLLKQGGMSIRLLEPNEVVSGAQASRIANGVLIESRFVGSDQAVLVQLVNLVPPKQRGAIGPVPNPVSMLIETHLTSMSIGAASVGVAAAPPFVIPDFPLDPGFVGDPGTAVAGPTDPGFSAPLPDLPAGASTGDGGGPTIDGKPIGSLVSNAIPAALIVMMVLASPFFAAGSGKLADNVLSEVSSGCPEGLDKPRSAGARRPEG